MVFFPLDFVLRGFPVAEYFMYASPKTLVRPCPTKKPSFMNMDIVLQPRETTPAPSRLIKERNG